MKTNEWKGAMVGTNGRKFNGPCVGKSVACGNHLIICIGSECNKWTPFEDEPLAGICSTRGKDLSVLDAYYKRFIDGIDNLVEDGENLNVSKLFTDVVAPMIDEKTRKVVELEASVEYYKGVWRKIQEAMRA